MYKDNCKSLLKTSLSLIWTNASVPYPPVCPHVSNLKFWQYRVPKHQNLLCCSFALGYLEVLCLDNVQIPLHDILGLSKSIPMLYL